MKKECRRLVIVYTALSAIAAATGCDSRLVGPAPPRGTDTTRPDESGASAVIGTTRVTSEQTAFTGGIPAPANTWIVVEVSGQFQAVQNPNCGLQPPEWPCSSLAPAGSFSSSPAAFGPVQVQATYGANRTGLVDLRGAGGAGTAGQAIGLYYGTESGVIQARSTLVNPIAYNPNPGPPVASWILSGSYSMTATRIASPLSFFGSPSKDATGSVTFGVSPAASLAFFNPAGVPPSWAPGAPDWYFIQGDSVPAEYEHASPALQIGACFQKTSCTWTPPKGKNGRMQVAAYVEGRLVIARSGYVQDVQQKRVELICSVGRYPNVTDLSDPVNRRGSISLTRAEAIGCIVAAYRVPAGWRADTLFFTDRDGNTIGSPNSMSTGGSMVVGGTLTVRGRIDGRTYTDEMQVAVQPRNWRQTPPPIKTYILRCPPPTTRECPVTFPPYYSGDLGRTNPGAYNISVATVTSGPNSGWSFIANSTPPWQPEEIKIFLNIILSPSDSTSYGREFFHFSTPCSRDELRKEVEDHERTHANSAVRNLDPINEWLEGLLAFGIGADPWRQRLSPGGDLRAEVTRRMQLANLEHRAFPELLQQFPKLECPIKGLENGPPLTAGTF